MFQNYSANAGIILGGGSNIIDSRVQWNFNNVIVLNYDPSDNTNDRPRINFWRSDDDYLVYMSGGLNVLTPAPTGVITQPWGDRTSGTFNLKMPISPEGGIDGGIDLFTHDFAPPSFLFPPLNSGWTVSTNPNVPNELKYQYKFKRGETNPNVIIILNYSGCLPPFIPTCPSGQFLSYTRINDCPTFSCYNPLAVSLGTILKKQNEFFIFPGPYSGVGNYNFGLGLASNYNSSWVAYGGKVNTVKIYKGGVRPINSSTSTENYYDLPDEIYGNLQTWFGYSLDMNKDGSILVVGAPKFSISGQTENGMAQVYTGIGGNGRTLTGISKPYSVSQLLIGETGSAGNLDNFGSSVKITDLGNVIFVAAYGDDNDRGAIYAFTGNKINKWSFKEKITASGFTNINNARQGQYRNMDCANDGSVLIVGGSLWSGNYGKVLIYTGNALNGWIYKDSLTAPFGTTFGSAQEFGYSVTCNNDASIIAVGAQSARYSGNLVPNGMVYIYTGSKNTTWNLRQILSGTLSPNNNNMGRSVKTNDDGNTIYTNLAYARETDLIGYPFFSGNPTGYSLGDMVICYTGNSIIGWKYKEHLKQPMAELFGESIVTNDDGTYLQIGAPNRSSPYLTFPASVAAGSIELYKSIQSERGFLYSFPDTSWSNGTGIANFGKWYLNNNGLSQTIIGDSTVNGTRTGIGEPSFLFYPGLTLFNNYSNGFFVFDDNLTRNDIEFNANFGAISNYNGGLNGIEFWSGANQGDQLFRLQYGFNGDSLNMSSLYLWTGSTFKVKLLNNIFNRRITATVNVRPVNTVFPTLSINVNDGFNNIFTGIRLPTQPSLIKQVGFYAGGGQNIPLSQQALCGMGINNISIIDPTEI